MVEGQRADGQVGGQYVRPVPVRAPQPPSADMGGKPPVLQGEEDTILAHQISNKMRTKVVWVNTELVESSFKCNETKASIAW